MRNLKRVLALALALVMMLGMMITASAASYTDEAAIDADYAEAVEVLSDIGVFKGTGAGFAPKQVLTRAEASALIYRVITGDVKDKQIDLYDYASFADVEEGKWYTGYITYAANGGYIKGYNGNAMPNDVVTGIQVLAIMLRAAGYGQNGEYEGAAWKDNILTDAFDLKLTAGISTNDLDKPASRELTAQLLFNAITKAKIVTYTPALGYIPYKLTALAPSQTLGEKVFSLKEGTDRDQWGRPYHGWTWKVGVVPGATWFVDEHTAYTVAISDCQIAVDMGLKKNVDYTGKVATITVYDNGVKGTDTIDVTAQAPINGAQGTQIEVYENEVVIIDTYLAEVGTVTAEKTDKNGHVIVPASTALTVYKFNDTGIDPVMAGAEYKKGDMILVNICEGGVDTDGEFTYIEAANDDKVVTAVGLAPSFVGTQTDLYFNVEKHEVNDVVYFDAVHFYLDPAGYQGGNWTWYQDQFGNLIGNAEIVDPSSYGVIKSIQWINVEDQAGYAKAVIVDMTGAETVMKIAKIDGATAVYGAWYGADFDVDAGIAEISTNIADNYTEYCGLDLYEIKETVAGAILTSVAEVAPADVKTNVPVITGATNVLVDNDTMYLIRKATTVPGVYTFAPVTGYTNVADYTGSDVVVDYVNLDKDAVAEYVYITGKADSSVASEYVYITNNWNIHAALKTIGGIDYYTVTGVVRADGSTDPLYVKGDIAAATLVNWMNANVDKLFKVTTTDGKITNLTTDLVEVTSVNQEVGTNYAYFAGSVSVIGNGMIVTEDGRQWNVNATTAVANKDGVGTIADLTAANLAGKHVYVVGVEYPTTSHVNYYVAKAIFITELDSLKAAQENSEAALKAYINAEVAALNPALTDAAADATTDITATGWPTGYETMAKVVAKWTTELKDETRFDTAAEVEAHLAALKTVFDNAKAAKVYVNNNASSTVTVVTAASELSAAITGAADGDTVLLGAGTYALTDLITADVTIVGDGNVVLETAQTSAQQCAIYACGDVTIKGVTFKGMTNIAPCVVTQTGSNATVKIEDCTFEVTNVGVYLNGGVTGGYIKNCTFKMATGSYAAIGVDGLAGAFEISGNTFVGTGSHGYDVETFASNGTYLTVTGATVNPLP